VSVRFFDGVSRSMKVKDLNVTKDYQKVYKPGKVIRVAVNKLERLCTKQLVIEACLSQANKSAQNELMSQVGAFAQQYHQSLEQAAPLKVGEQVEAEVQLIKDYGLIVTLKLDSDVKTGFILNDHKLSQKYKPGQKLTCRVLDIDSAKKIADLKEVDTASQKAKKDFKAGQKNKGIVELNKEGYLVVSLKSSRQTIGLLLNSNFNQDQEARETYQIGESIEVVAVKQTNGVWELVKVQKETEKKATSAGAPKLSELKAGIRFTGQIKSIKQQCLYIQLPKSEHNPK